MTAAFEDLDRRHRAALYARARRLVAGTHLDPEDVVQDALLRAWRKPPDDPAALPAWLHVVVRNRALELLRSPDVRRRDDATPLDGRPAPADVATAVVEREELRELVGAVRRLPARQARALVMHAVDGCSHVEVAAGLGTTPGGAKLLVHRARRRLRGHG